MPTPAAPVWRRARQPITIATSAVALTLSVFAGVAFGQSGGVDAPDGGTPPPPSGGDGSGANVKLGEAQAAPRRSYFDGLRAPRVTYKFEGDAPADVLVEVVSRSTKAVVDSWVVADAPPETANTAYWDGRTASGGIAKGDDYKFRVGGSGGKTEGSAKTRFAFHGYKFPIARRHQYGDGVGAGRGHQGQDVFARCGTKLVAARGGTVQWNKSQSSAGNYLVIDARGTDKDYFYAHLKRRSPLEKGARVRTGQAIGKVGQTGNASGCHLHFEIWSAPGWYEGGDALGSVTRSLKKWDKWS